jgi:hypothetical protein
MIRVFSLETELCGVQQQKRMHNRHTSATTKGSSKGRGARPKVELSPEHDRMLRAGRSAQWQRLRLLASDKVFLDQTARLKYQLAEYERTHPQEIDSFFRGVTTGMPMFAISRKLQRVSDHS